MRENQPLPGAILPGGGFDTASVNHELHLTAHSFGTLFTA